MSHRTPSKLNPQNVEDILTLTPVQQGMLFHYLSETSAELYVEQFSFRISGEFDFKLFQEAWNWVIVNNEMLRAVFRWEGLEKPVQVILKQFEAPIYQWDFSGKDAVLQEAAIAELKINDRRQKIDISAEPYRILLCKLHDCEYEMMITSFHILFDGWSNGIILKELLTAYDGLREGRELSPLPKTRYKEFLKWSNKQDPQKAAAFWRNHLQGFDTKTQLPYDHKRRKTMRVETYTETYSADFTFTINQFAQVQSLTTATLLYCAWGFLLQKYSNIDDVVFGTTVSGRTPGIKGIEEIVGLFINTPPLRLQANSTETVSAFLHRTQRILGDRAEFEYTPLTEIRPLVAIASQDNFFDSIVVIENYPLDQALSGYESGFSLRLESIFEMTHYDIAVEISTFDAIDLRIIYDAHLFDPETIQRIAGHFGAVLQNLIGNFNSSLAVIDILTESEKRRMLFDFNNTAADYPREMTIHQLFEAQVDRMPDQIAVVYPGASETVSLTYRELNQRANQLAMFLRGVGVQSGQIVGLLMERSLAMIVGIMGTLKAGGAYLPIDPEYPADRIQYILEDGGVGVLLTQSVFQEKYQFRQEVVEIDNEKIYGGESTNLEVINPPQDLAYVIYTSGTTGKPKGMMIEHKNVVRLMFNDKMAFDFNQNDVWTMFHSYCFDFSVWEMYGALLYGGKLIVIPKITTRDTKEYLKLLKREKVTVLNQTPSAFYNLIDEELQCPDRELNIRYVIFGGEALKPGKLKDWSLKYPKTELINMYGITETTVHVTYKEITEQEINLNISNIGRPIPTLTTYIMDQNMKLQPIGVAGELYVGGDGVGRGYLNRPELTEEKFGSNPYLDGERLYRSGDLVRYLQNGEMEYLGRIDHQVKIRGFRIELGEVESVLHKYKYLRDVVVLPKEDQAGDKYLVAYIVTDRKYFRVFNGKQLYKLPNNLFIDHLNKNETDFMYKEIFEEQNYFQGGIRIKDGDCVFDVGANIGIFTLLVNQLYSNIEVYAFEPIPTTFAALKNNVHLHCEKTKVFNCGISNENTVKTFTFYPKASVMSSCFGDVTNDEEVFSKTLINENQISESEKEALNQHLNELLEGRFEERKVDCQLKTLSEIFKEHNIARVDLLKIDVEKSELDVLKGIADNDWGKIRQLVIEVHDLNGQLTAVMSLLEKRGYKVMVGKDEVLGEAGLYTVYAINPLHEDLGKEQDINEKRIHIPIPKVEEVVSANKIRDFLSGYLPDYMIPSYFVQLEKLPLTPNGKIDRKALPNPELGENINTGIEYVAPRDETEAKLAKIWAEVLGLEKVGIHDNFFELGGHSLKATVLVSKIQKELNTAIPLKDVFQYPTIAQLAQVTDRSEKNIFPAILPSEKKEYYPLSSAQKRLFILEQLEGASTTYNLPSAIIIGPGLDIPRLNEAFNQFIKRHTILRTSFEMFQEEPIQRVHDEFRFQLETTPIGAAEINDVITEFIQPFDLSQPSLIRAKIYLLNNGNQLLLFDIHHIITDGVTMNVLLDEISRLYEGKDLPALSLHYYDYALWQNNLLATNQLHKEEAFWLNELAGELPVLNLPLDNPRPAAQSFEGNRIYFELNETSAAGLKSLASQNGATLFMVLLAAYNILLAKYSSQEDIIVGTPVAGRPHADLEKMVGMFVNTIVLRNYPQAGKRFTDFLAEVKNKALKAFEHQNYEFDLLIGKLDLPRELSRNPLFDVMLAFEDLDLDDVKLGDLQLTRYEFENKISKFDLLLYVFSKGKGILFELEYNTSLFTQTTITKMKVHFLRIIDQILADPFKEIMNIDFLTPAEKQKLLVEYNGYRLDFKDQKTLHQLFEAMAVQKPDYVAAAMDGQSISYRQLNQKSNQMARMLQEAGAVNQSVIGVMMDKSFATLISLMGILKAGAAYLPIDPSYPSERINHMLADSGARVLITNGPAIKDASFTQLQNLSKGDCKITATPPREHLIEFDRLPMPDRNLIDIGKYKNKIGMASASNCISLQTTRGCPYLCLFCHKVWSKKHVFRSATNIFNEIEHYYRKGVVNFSILDDCFNLNSDNGKELFKLITGSGMKLQIFFPNGLRGDILTNDYIDLMVEAGVVNINLSLETASPRLQKLIKKHLNLDKFKQIMDYIAAQHPNVILELATMHGFPTETEEEALMTLNFIKDIKWIHFPYIHILKVYPNTEIEELALANGVTQEDILKSVNLAYHEIPETLPFPKSFTRRYQAEFLNEYFLSEPRLKQVLPIQTRILSEAALIDKYSAYLPVEIKSIQDIIDFAGIRDFELQYENKSGQEAPPTIFDSKFERRINPNSAAKKILLLDLSQFFSSYSMLYKVYEQPLGQLYLLTYLKEKFGDRIDGRIYKSGVDFDSFDELKKLIKEYQPDLIGIRTLSLYKEFFHQTVSLIKQWGISAPIITGGPYATSDYDFLLNDPEIDLAVLGEGELTLAELIGLMLQNGFKIPAQHLLSNIKGIAFRETAPQTNRRVILMDDTDFLDHYPAENLNVKIGPEHAAYVMYTSGSTGKPKGIAVEHQQVNNCISWMQHEFPLQPGNIVLQRTNLTFDPSVWEIFWTLSQGGAIQLLTIAQGKDANHLIELLKDNHEITMMYCPASLVTGMTYILTTIHDDPKARAKLKLPWLFIGAEPISAETVKTFYTYFEGQIVNTYGPTECAINNTYIQLDRNDERPVIPIGKPVANNQIYILSNHLQLAPPGLPGEICIAGDSVARGYLNNPEKTAGSFIKNPFGEGRLYRTGDIGKWTGDGNIEIMGRIDEQVKIRGYRIEIGEIEAALKKNKRVKDCVAVVHDTQKKTKIVKTCKKCGLTSAYPEARIDDDGICNICNSTINYQRLAADYFRTMDDLDRVIREVNQAQGGRGARPEYDCMLLYAGGRGAAYALYQLVGRGYKVITATYDNGYFSKDELAKIKMITGKLNVEHVVLTHPKTEEILRESIKSAHTVCKGCFFTSSSLAYEFALKNNIKLIIGATLSRGQIIDNKLFKLFNQGTHEVAEIEKELANIQRLTPQMNEEIFEPIGIESVKNGTAYEQVKAIDFYRYCDVTNEEIINYLNHTDPYWIKRKNYAVYSTNCPIKQLGDLSHLNERGFHYYGSATSWEKRLGHITGEKVKEDLQINVSQPALQNFHQKIKLEPGKKKRILETKFICAYIATEDELEDELNVAKFREDLMNYLPEYMIPSYFVPVPRIPLTPEGKVNKKLLPEPDLRRIQTNQYEAPSNEVEGRMVELWKEVLSIEKVGINDNFFELGGHSLKATILVSKIVKEFQTEIQLSAIFKNPTVKEISRKIEEPKANAFSAILPSEPQELVAKQNLQAQSKLPDFELAFSATFTAPSQSAGVSPEPSEVPKEYRAYSIDGPDQKELPVKLDIDNTAYLHYSLPFAVLLADERLLPWYYEHFINIFACPGANNNHNLLRFDFLEYEFTRNQFLTSIQFNYELLADLPDVVPFLLDKINHGYYAIINVDEYDLPEKAAYQKEHFVHPSLIYGYHHSERRLLALGFDQDNLHTKITLDYDQFVKAYENGKVNFQETAPWAEKKALELLRFKNHKTEYPFDLKRFLGRLDDYLAAVGDNSVIYHYELPDENVVYGAGVYDEVVRQLKNNVLNRRLTLDYIGIHFLAEHKRGIYNRLRYVASRYGVSADLVKMIEEYYLMVEQFETIRIRCLEFIYADDQSSLVNLEKVVKELIEVIESIQAKERPLLSDISKRLKLSL